MQDGTGRGLRRGCGVVCVLGLIVIGPDPRPTRAQAPAPPSSVPERPPGLPPLPDQNRPGPPAPTPPAAGSPIPEAGPLGRAIEAMPLPLPMPGRGGSAGEVAPPGLPPRGGRPMPGSPLDPGAAGPGLGRTSQESLLGGAFDPRTGWPFVLLDHFRPRPERVERLWIVGTRACPQVMGTDPWPCLQVLHFDDRGELQERSPQELFAQTIGRPVLIQVQGSHVTREAALGGLLWTHSWLELNGALPPDAVVIAFDWPSQRVYQNDIRDINEKGRRAYVAGYHLARFVQGFPAESRICLLGQSYGGRVVPSALHLLGGGRLNSQDHDPEVALPGPLRPDLHLRAILLEGASDHQWLDPDQRLDRALTATEAMLNLFNRRDQALRFYPLLRRSGHHRALGRIGLTNRDFQQIGALAARYQEHDIHNLLGSEHSLLDSVANRQIARWMAPYLWSPDPGDRPAWSEEFAGEFASGRGLRLLSGFGR